MKIETELGQIISVNPADLLPAPSRRGGRGKRVAGEIARVLPAPILVVNWDAIEVAEKSGRKISPDDTANPAMILGVFG